MEKYFVVCEDTRHVFESPIRATRRMAVWMLLIVISKCLATYGERRRKKKKKKEKRKKGKKKNICAGNVKYLTPPKLSK